MNLPLGAITVITLISSRLPDAQLNIKANLPWKKQIARLDFPGNFLFACFIIMLLMAIDWGGVTYAWSSSIIIGLFCGSASTFCIFLLWELRQGDAALLPLALFRNTKVCCAAASGIMSYGGLYVIIIYLPLWFQTAKGVSPLESGIYYLPSVITTTLGTIVSGSLG